MTSLRTIIVGFGNVSSGLTRDPRMAAYFDYASHAAVLADHPAFDWQGVVDPNAAALDDARKNWNVAHCGADLAEVVQAVRPEIAVLATPPGQRADMIAQMPDLKAIMVEKPLNMPGQREDGTRLADVCAEREIPVLVNYWRRADRLFQELAAGDMVNHVGKAQAVTGLYGNGLANNGGHLIDFMRMLLGEVTAVQALAAANTVTTAPLSGDVQVPFALTFANETVATVHPLDFNLYREVGLDIWGEKGRLSILQESLVSQVFPIADNRGLSGEREIASDVSETLQATVADAFYRMYDNLADVARGRGAPCSPLSSALLNERIIDCILQSAAEGGIRLTLD